MSVRVVSHIDRWKASTKNNIDKVVLEMATDIDRVAKMNAPKDTRALVNSAVIDKKGDAHYTVTFGGNGNGFSVPYARMRHFENKKNPQTIGYLENAGKDTARNIKRYLKDI